MCHPIFKMPSFYAHALNGILILFAFLLVLLNMNELKKLKSSKILIIILLFSIGVGIHSLTHLGLERAYGFNPLTN